MLNRSESLDRVFAALADPTRRAVIARLARGPASVSELAKPLKMSLPAIAPHLKALEQSGFVVSEKVGRVRTCRIDPKQLEAAQTWLAEQRSVWEARFDRMDAFVLALGDSDDVQS
ncbi:MAG: metalloregulator ArsR/SmtB family transcription factor [Alphaproteobacteria bacterium]|nr:metalloregulator ArsR/SmtB family transcription factor [Alphaproteobacteria bacterium]